VNIRDDIENGMLTFDERKDMDFVKWCDLGGHGIFEGEKYFVNCFETYCIDCIYKKSQTAFAD
jgi:hypothetical protein